MPAQVAPSNPMIQIAPYKDDHVAALCYTFDDGIQDQFSLAVPLLESHGFHGTFFIIPSRVVDTDAQVAAKKPGDWGGVTWTRLREVAAHGHEIASHSWSHPNLRTSDATTVAFEIAHADEVLHEKLGIFPLTFCYPGNGATDDIQNLVLKNHLADRNGGVHLPSIGTPARFSDYQMIGFGGKDFTLEKANAAADQLIKEGKWATTVIHAIETGYAPFSAKILSDHFDYVKTLQDKIWVDTFANVAGYVRQRMVAKISLAAHTSNSVTFTLTAELPPPPTGITFPPAPLTLRVIVPGATSATAARNGHPLPVTLRPDRILLTAEPDPAPIILVWK